MRTLLLNWSVVKKRLWTIVLQDTFLSTVTIGKQQSQSSFSQESKGMSLQKAKRNALGLRLPTKSQNCKKSGWKYFMH